MIKLLNKWRGFDFLTKIAILAIPLCVLIFARDCMTFEWSKIIPTEERYVALEKIAYEIVESKNVTQPLSEELKWYDVIFNEDRTLNISLYGEAETLRVKLSENYEIKSFTRSYVVSIIYVIAVIIGAVVMYFIQSVIIVGALYGIVICIKKIYLFSKK